jgi:hypothetical protein
LILLENDLLHNDIHCIVLDLFKERAQPESIEGSFRERKHCEGVLANLSSLGGEQHEKVRCQTISASFVGAKCLAYK